MTYAELLSLLSDESYRDDLSAKFPSFILIAESELELMLVETDLLDKVETITVLSGSSIIPFPADCLKFQSAGVTGEKPINIIEDQSNFSDFYNQFPRYGAVVGRSIVMSKPFTADATIRFKYKSKIVPLTAIQSNAVFDLIPMVYFYMALACLERNAKNDAGYQMYFAKASEYIARHKFATGYDGTNSHVALGGVV
jgi:hypothetical protein